MTDNIIRSNDVTRPRRTRLIADSEVIKVGDWITDAAIGAENVDGIVPLRV